MSLIHRILRTSLFCLSLSSSFSSRAGDDIEILFLGNSYTARHDIPGLVEQVLEQGDPETNVNVSRVIYGGQNMFKHSTYYFSGSFIEQSTITEEEISTRIARMQEFLKSETAPNPAEWETHWNSIDPNRKMSFADIHRHIKSAIRNHEALLKENPRKKWDYVVLQSWRDVSPDVDQAYGRYATQLAKMAQKQGAEVILYMTSPETQNQEPVTAPVSPESAKRDIMVGLELVERIHPKAVVHVPLAIRMIQTDGTDLCFRYVNDGHPNQTCAFLTANLFYAAFTGKNPKTLSFDTIVETKVKDGKDPDGGALKRVFDEKTKVYLQNTAFEASREFKRLSQE